MPLADTYNPQLTKLRQRAEEVEGNALTGCCVKVQIISDGDVNEIVRCQPPIFLRFEIVRGVIAARVTCRRQEFARFWIISAIRQELQHEKGMSCAPFPQVYFDGHMTPSITLFDRNEIDAEAAKNAFVRKCPCRLRSARLNI